MKFVGLLVVMMSIVPPQINWDVYEAICEQRYISEQGLERVRLSCYLATGNNTADGSVPKEGYISCNLEHLGMDCLLFDEDLFPVARFECRDIGGNKLLQKGEAIDVYRDSMQRAKEFIAEHGDYAYIKWIPRDFEGRIPLPEYAESLPICED